MRRVQQAWSAAEHVLTKHRVQRTPVDVRRLAEHYARVIERPLDPDIAGVLVPTSEGSWVILVNSSHPPVRQRFTIAHELGHLILHGYRAPHADRAFRFRDARSSEGSALEEIQANQFAAELLMPREMVMKAARVRRLEHGSDDADDAAFDEWIAAMAKKFGVSKQALAIRFSSLFA